MTVHSVLTRCRLEESCTLEELAALEEAAFVLEQIEFLFLPLRSHTEQ